MFIFFGDPDLEKHLLNFLKKIIDGGQFLTINNFLKAAFNLKLLDWNAQFSSFQTTHSENLKMSFCILYVSIGLYSNSHI